MDAIVPYAIIAAIIIAGLGILAILVFSLRGLSYGKVEPISLGIMAVPLVLVVVLGLIMPSWAMAAIWAALIMFALALVALFASGLRSFFIS